MADTKVCLCVTHKNAFLFGFFSHGDCFTGDAEHVSGGALSRVLQRPTQIVGPGFQFRFTGQCQDSSVVWDCGEHQAFSQWGTW